MQNRQREFKQNIVIFVLNIVIVIMSILMVICGCVAVSSLYDAFSPRMYSEQSLYYCVQDGDFGRLVSYCHEGMQESDHASARVKEYYGIAKYYEAASFYKAFLETGDTERAEQAKAKMEQAYAEMGSWNIVQEEIHELLGIE